MCVVNLCVGACRRRGWNWAVCSEDELGVCQLHAGVCLCFHRQDGPLEGALIKTTRFSSLTYWLKFRNHPLIVVPEMSSIILSVSVQVSWESR